MMISKDAVNAGLKKIMSKMGCPAVKMSSWDDEHDEHFMGKSGSRLIILILG
jgi:hypothetical protein